MDKVMNLCGPKIQSDSASCYPTKQCSKKRGRPRFAYKRGLYQGSKSIEKANKAANRCVLKEKYCKRQLDQRELYS